MWAPNSTVHPTIQCQEDSIWSILPYTQVPVESNLTLDGHLWMLQSPTLDIEWQDYGNATSIWYGPGNTTMSGEWIQETGHSSCLPSNTYQWGFSSLMLFCFCIATTVFVCVVVALRRNNERHSRASQYKQHFSLYRDVLDLASELHTLGDEDIEEMSANEIEKYVTQHKGSVRLKIDELLPSASEQRARSRKENVTYGRAGFDHIKHILDSLPAFKNIPMVHEEEIALRSTPSTQHVFEGT